MFDLIIFVSVIAMSIFLGYRYGKRAAQPNIYYNGKAEGWKACEDLVIERMVKSKNMDLTRREVLDEFFM